MTHLKFICFFIIIAGISLYAQSSAFQTASLFQDNMVLQQQSTVPIWGKGIPGTDVVIKTSWKNNVTVTVDSNGSWSALLRTPKAGGPFQITIRHGSTLSVLKNVLLGEVWLCSGQSNMEMPLQGWPPNDTISYSANEIEQALYPSIRLFTVAHDVETDPTEQCMGTWTECSPTDVRGFSATAFYFGKTLHQTLNVPIGLINTSFGGTPVEAWMDKQSLVRFEEYAAMLSSLDENHETIRHFEQWIIKHPSIAVRESDPSWSYSGLDFGDVACSQRTFNDTGWNDMVLPTNWEKSSVGVFDGVIWFRKTVVIPSSWVGKNLVIELGPIDDMDETFVNGQKIGEQTGNGFWNINRRYTIPASSVYDSAVQIAVRVIDLRGGGGFWGNGAPMFISADSTGMRVPLEGAWKYLPVAEFRKNTFYVYGVDGNEFRNRPVVPVEFTQSSPTSLFNGMINPLLPFTIKGCIWYQGESNVSQPDWYRTLFPTMISSWRTLFKSGEFPFYFVQIAPYDYGTMRSSLLREAQFRTLSASNTGMAVTLDIGTPKNIHPPDKNSVGKRLADWALAKTYGKHIAYSGPLYRSMKKIKGAIVLTFDAAGNGLVLKERNGEHFISVAGEDKVFRKAVVKIRGKNLIVSHPDIRQPAAVRYAWGNTDEGTLFNKEGLPASSFRTDDWND